MSNLIISNCLELEQKLREVPGVGQVTYHPSGRVIVRGKTNTCAVVLDELRIRTGRFYGWRVRLLDELGTTEKRTYLAMQGELILKAVRNHLFENGGT